ncbi:MAG: hypothetical protein WCR58_09210 [Bacteroidales bacterium]|jgi:hypothetical protein|nr:hypothetical protein [Bacteroidales bacterium]MDD3700564.1 hypothetical protein [Bacteroidales bacterium]MDY0368312.1 hypothetical protein [Bacteroidales bacterium]
MSNIEHTESNQNNPKTEIVQPQLPKSEVRAMFHELEIMAMQKGSRNTLDLNKLDKDQIDKVLDTMAENEKNAFAFHSKRLDAIKEIELRKIEASVINQKTLKFVLIGVLIFVLPAITLLILFFKDTFFIPWLTFLTGILGGLGLSKIMSSIFKTQDTKNPIKEVEEID